MEPVGKDVKQEPADEFVSVKRHELLAVAIAIILPAKLDLAVIDIEQTIVRNRDAMRVSRNILENLFRSGEGLFRVHHPILFLGKSDVTQEGVAYAKWFQAGKELQIAGIEGLPQIIEEQSPKETRQNGNGQEEI